MPETTESESDDHNERRVWQRPMLRRLIVSDAENFEGSDPDSITVS